MRPGASFIAGGAVGDAEAPLVVDGEIRRPACTLQGTPTGGVGKSASDLGERGSSILPAKAGIGRASCGRRNDRQQSQEEDREWRPVRHAPSRQLRWPSSVERWRSTLSYSAL